MPGVEGGGDESLACGSWDPANSAFHGTSAVALFVRE